MHRDQLTAEIEHLAFEFFICFSRVAADAKLTQDAGKR